MLGGPTWPTLSCSRVGCERPTHSRPPPRGRGSSLATLIREKEVVVGCHCDPLSPIQWWVMGDQHPSNHLCEAKGGCERPLRPTFVGKRSLRATSLGWRWGWIVIESHHHLWRDFFSPSISLHSFFFFFFFKGICWFVKDACTHGKVW
jgi:hypothetical protein